MMQKPTSAMLSQTCQILKNRLQNAETNYTEVSTEIDGIHGELSSKVDSSEFDLMQSKITENTTAISQTRDDISLRHQDKLRFSNR